MPIRLDKLVADRFGLSRRSAREAILLGRIDLEGSTCTDPGLAVDSTCEPSFHPNRPKARKVKGELRALYEDRDVIVVAKPPGILTLPTAAHEPGTLLERVSDYLRIRHGRSAYVGVLHRLDKDTSGALAYAKNPRALRAFQKLFKEHAIERSYYAVVEGSPARDEATIDLAVSSARGELRRGVARGADPGRRAVTHYRVIERFGPIAALVACRLETGRTHQIRIHMAAIGHPVVGDRVYRAKGAKLSRAKFTRQALHAQALGFIHPISGKEVRVEAPPPQDFEALISDLRNRYGRNSGRPQFN